MRKVWYTKKTPSVDNGKAYRSRSDSDKYIVKTAF